MFTWPTQRVTWGWNVGSYLEFSEKLLSEVASANGLVMGKKQVSVARRGNDTAALSAPKTVPNAGDYDPSVDEPTEPLIVESTVISRETATHLAFAKR